MAYIPALVIQHDAEIYISDSGVVGLTELIPTPSSGGGVDYDYWATPVNNFGIIGNGFKYTPTTAANNTPPTPQSFHVVRIIFTVGYQNSTAWYALGTSTQYVAASEQVEGTVIASPPAIMPTASSLPNFAPCQLFCTQNATTGLYQGNVGLPTLAAGQTYHPVGYFDGIAFTSASGAGYSSVSALLTFLNTNWTNVGSPAIALTWTATSDNLTLIFTANNVATGTDTICVAVNAA